MSAARGFSLIELVLVVALAAILATLSLAGVRLQADRAKRQEARIALLKLAAEQQLHFVREGHYAADLIALGSATATRLSASGRYRLRVDSNTPSGFVLRATLQVPGREQSRCAWLALDQSQRRTAGPLGSAECWFR
ncbi:MAG: type IV pilin protein [Pseudomonadota bacterium]